jgi:hypothetical protein
MIASFLVCILLFSCSENKTKNKQQEPKIDLTNLKINIDSLNVGNGQLVFKYQNETQLKERTAIFFDSIFAEANNLFTSNSKITNVFFKLKFTQGKATMEDIYMVDVKNKNVITSSPEKKITWKEVLHKSSCPEGRINAKHCPNASCAADTTETMLANLYAGIISNDDCTQIQYSIGLASTTICSIGCE